VRATIFEAGEPSVQAAINDDRFLANAAGEQRVLYFDGPATAHRKLRVNMEVFPWPCMLAGMITPM